METGHIFFKRNRENVESCERMIDSMLEKYIYVCQSTIIWYFEAKGRKNEKKKYKQGNYTMFCAFRELFKLCRIVNQGTEFLNVARWRQEIVLAAKLRLSKALYSLLMSLVRNNFLVFTLNKEEKEKNKQPAVWEAREIHMDSVKKGPGRQNPVTVFSSLSLCEREQFCDERKRKGFSDISFSRCSTI